MKVQNKLNFAKNYFSGFDDVYKHESINKTIVGLLKILSYAFILPPILLGGIYLKSKKICILQKKLNEKLDEDSTASMNKTSNAANKTLKLSKIPDISQKEMIQYLIDKLVNYQNGDDLKLEQSRFEKGFKTLDFDEQKKIFEKANKSKCMRKAIEWIPIDITELNFISGPKDFINYHTTNSENLYYLSNKLESCNNLKKIKLDLRGLGLYGFNANSKIKAAIETPVTNIENFSGDEDVIYRSNHAIYRYVIKTQEIFKAISVIEKLIEKNKDLDWDLDFININVTTTGTVKRGTIIKTGDNDENFGITIMGYLNP